MSGETCINPKILCGLHEHVEHAKNKHPWPDNYPPHKMYRAAEGELYEMAAAMLKGDARGTVEEALDFAAVGVRIAEYYSNGDRANEKTGSNDV